MKGHGGSFVVFLEKFWEEIWSIINLDIEKRCRQFICFIEKSALTYIPLTPFKGGIRDC